MFLPFHSCRPIVCAVAVLITAWLAIGGKVAGADPDYPNVKPELSKVIVGMKAGQFDGKVPMPWRLYEPAKGNADQKFPLVVALHGAGGRGTDNVKPMSIFAPFFAADVQAKYPCYIIAPQMRLGHAWVKTKGFTNYSADEQPASDEMLTMFSLVEQTIKDNPINPDRVYVVGQSMGGYGAWDAITRRPELWAAAVPIAGGGDPSKAAVFKDIPIWAWHGNKDTTVPVENTRAVIEAIKKIGGDPKYTEIPVGHSSWNNAYAEPKLYEWLFAQKRSATAKK